MYLYSLLLCFPNWVAVTPGGLRAASWPDFHLYPTRFPQWLETECTNTLLQGWLSLCTNSLLSRYKDPNAGDKDPGPQLLHIFPHFVSSPPASLDLPSQKHMRFAAGSPWPLQPICTGAEFLTGPSSLPLGEPKASLHLIHLCSWCGHRAYSGTREYSGTLPSSAYAGPELGKVMESQDYRQTLPQRGGTACSMRSAVVEMNTLEGFFSWAFTFSPRFHRSKQKIERILDPSWPWWQEPFHL